MAALLAGCDPQPRSCESCLVLQGATLYDGTGNVIHEATVIVDGTRIDTVGTGLPIPQNARVFDISGKFMMPGLVDAHVHYGQSGFYDARPDAVDLRDSLPYEQVQKYLRENVEKFHTAYLRSGVTAVYDVGGFTWSLALQEDGERATNIPHISASGPLLTLAPPNFLTTFHLPGDTMIVSLDSPEKARRWIRSNSEDGATGIKLWALAPVDLKAEDILQAIASEVKAQSNYLITHATGLEAAKAAIGLGTKVLVHAVNEDLVDQEFIELMKEEDVIMVPTVIVSSGYLKTMEAILGAQDFEIMDPYNTVDDRIRGLLEGASQFQKYVDLEGLRSRVARMRRFVAREDSIIAENLRMLYQEGVVLAVGTDAGNPGTLHGVSIFEELLAMQAIGISPGDLIVMATRNGARAMGRLDDFGTVTAGKVANLLVLSDDPAEDIANVRSQVYVLKQGQIIKPSSIH